MTVLNCEAARRIGIRHEREIVLILALPHCEADLHKNAGPECSTFGSLPHYERLARQLGRITSSVVSNALANAKAFADFQQGIAPANQIESLERENAFLREEISRLRRRL